jgi:murein L,D-transpeptidase YcbB/YkuD
MLCRSIVGLAAVALSIGVAGCNRPAQETRDDAKDTAAAVADATADAQRQRDAEVSRLTSRVADIEREFAVKSEQLAAGTRTATGGLREEVKEDVANVKEAVANLTTTTADNWWEREEQAMRRAVEDVGSDVKRVAGRVLEPAPVATDTPATEPFTSRRDAFVTQMKGRVNTFRRALEPVKASGPRETEVSDLKARVEKLAEDLDTLARASADDWWGVTKDRVEAYIDRVEASVKRLDDNKPKAE